MPAHRLATGARAARIGQRCWHDVGHEGRGRARVALRRSAWVRGKDGALIQLDVPPPSDDDVGKLVRTVCRKLTAAVDAWQAARGDVVDDTEDASVAALVLADVPKSPPRIVEASSVGARPVSRLLRWLFAGM